MDYKVIIEPDPEDGGYVVHCPALPGCYSQGDTREEAIANIKKNTWRYAKRQMTWFRKDKEIRWIENEKEARKLISDFLKHPS